MGIQILKNSINRFKKFKKIDFYPLLQTLFVVMVGATGAGEEWRRGGKQRQGGEASEAGELVGPLMISGHLVISIIIEVKNNLAHASLDI